MDRYFQQKHGIPFELVRVIYEFASLATELQEVVLRSAGHRNRQPWPYNYLYFRNWEYIHSQLERSGQVVVYDNSGRIRLMYISG